MKSIYIGCLVRHRILDAVGLVVGHTMWDGDWGAFEVKFNKPVNKGALKNLTHFVDRGRIGLINSSANLESLKAWK